MEVAFATGFPRWVRFDEKQSFVIQSTISKPQKVSGMGDLQKEKEKELGKKAGN